MLQALHPVQQWVARLNPRTYALLIGVLVGILGGMVGLLIAIAEPIIAIGVVLGVLLALYILSNVSVALYGIIAIMSLLPFGTIPVRIVFTPSLLDAALGAFVFVYLCQWMVGKRRTFTSTPVHLLILIYSAWLILCFVLGLRWAPPTSNILRGFAETLLAISMTFILVDFLRDAASLRRVVIILLAFAGVQASVAIVLYVLPDATTETILVRLARLGYPDGGVIRYIEDTQALGERAIGTWIDPNALGGILAIAASTIAPQIFAERPVLRSRRLAVVILLVVTAALVLTFSRASMLAFAVGLVFIGLLRYRKFLAILTVTVSIVILLPVAQPLVERFVDAFTGADLATQMRIGEYTDSLRLISRYPVFGVGFTGTPDIDLYTDVASMYLIMANQIGLVGVAIYAATMLAVFAYGLSAWQQVRDNPDLNAIFLGYHAALLTALVNAVADLYFFRLDFQASITLFWMTVALALASARLARESTVENRPSLK